MACKRVLVSFDENFLRKMDERVEQLSIKRSEYLRGLVIRDLER